MTTVEQQIAAQRASIIQAKAQARKVAEQQKISRRELQKRGLTATVKAKGEALRRKKISQAQLAEIAKVEAPFEKEATRYEKEIGIYGKSKTELAAEQQAYKQAKGMFERGISSAWLSIGKPTVGQIRIRKYLRKFEKQARIYSTPSSKAQAPGTYDPVTHSYVSPDGRGMTIAQAELPPGTKIIGAPEISAPSLPEILQPKFETPAQAQIYKKFVQPKFEQQQLETKRYQDLGYTSIEAQRLATASLAQGGVTFIEPKEIRKITRTTISEKVPGALRDVGAYVGKLPEKVYREVVPKVVTAIEKVPPILEREIAPVILGVGPIGVRAPTGITYGEALAAPVKAVEYVAEEAGETAELGYAIATGYLPEKWKPSKYVGPPGERPITPAEVTKALEEGWFEKAEKEGWYTPITPEKVGEVTEKVVKITPYATPVAIPYIGSEFIKGIQTVRHPEEEAERIFKEQILIPFKEQYAEAERTLLEGYELPPEQTTEELRAEYMPGIIEQVKQKGAVEAATSLTFLGGAAAFKTGQQIIKTTIPRGKYLGMTQKQYQTAIKEAEKELIKLGKQDIAWIGKVEKKAGKVFIRGEQKLGKLKRDVKVYGELKETEVGKVFIPYGKGEVVGEGVMLLGKKKIPYQYLEAQKFEVGADAISVRAGELIGHPKLIKKIPSKIKLLRESALIPEKIKPVFVRAEEALAKEIKVIPKALAEAETFKILGKTTTVPKVGTFALYKVKPKYLTSSVRLERAIKKQMKENIFFGGDVIKSIAPQVAIQLKPKKFLVVGRKEAGLFFVEEAKREVKYGMKIVGGVKTPFAKTFAELKRPVLVKIPKVPKPLKPIVKEVPKAVSQEYVPLMVGGTKFVPRGDYSGLIYGDVSGKYLDVGFEVTEVPAALMPPVVKPSVLPAIDVVTKLDVIPRIDVMVKPRVEVISVLETGEKFKYETALGLKRVTIPKFKEVLVTREVLREGLIPREALTFKQVQIQRETLRQIPIIKPAVVQRPRPPRLKPPKLIPFIKPPKKVITLREKLRKPVPERGYTFEIRRKGKWERAKIPFAYATKKGAEYMARKKVLKEAAASYKVVKAKKGKEVVRSRMKAGPKDYLFRKGKEEGVMVQKKKLRILTPGEKKEISYAGGIARMKKSKPGFFKQPVKKVKKKKVVKKKKGGKK